MTTGRINQVVNGAEEARARPLTALPEERSAAGPSLTLPSLRDSVSFSSVARSHTSLSFAGPSRGGLLTGTPAAVI